LIRIARLAALALPVVFAIKFAIGQGRALPEERKP
jgi:hypothetical protein